MIVVCPLSRLEAVVEQHRPERLISVIANGGRVTRPAIIAADNYLHVAINDIAVAQGGMILPGEAHVRRILDFAAEWDRQRPMVVHCFAGISRSTATAYMIAAAANPARDEAELAHLLRWNSPSATPNARMIALADQILQRDGRMVRAIQAIGRGADAFEGEPFTLPV